MDKVGGQDGQKNRMEWIKKKRMGLIKNKVRMDKRKDGMDKKTRMGLITKKVRMEKKTRMVQIRRKEWDG